jgi:hypothetical protein
MLRNLLILVICLVPTRAMSSPWLTCDKYTDRIPTHFELHINGGDLIETTYTEKGGYALIYYFGDTIQDGDWVDVDVRACDAEGCSDWVSDYLQYNDGDGGCSDWVSDYLQYNDGGGGCFIENLKR